MKRFYIPIISLLLSAQRALAQTSGSGSGGSGTSGKDLGTILNDTIAWSVGLGITIASLVIIYAGFLMLTAGGNAEQFEKGKKTIAYAVAGLVVLAVSRALVAIVNFLTGVGGSGT